MHYAQLSDADLLGKLIGTRESRRLYRGTLQPLFDVSSDESVARQKLVVARELVRRMLAEEMAHRCALASPTAVRDYLRLLFRGREYESQLPHGLEERTEIKGGDDRFRWSGVGHWRSSVLVRRWCESRP